MPHEYPYAELPLVLIHERPVSPRAVVGEGRAAGRRRGLGVAAAGRRRRRLGVAGGGGGRRSGGLERERDRGENSNREENVVTPYRCIGHQQQDEREHRRVPQVDGGPHLK